MGMLIMKKIFSKNNMNTIVIKLMRTLMKKEEKRKEEKASITEKDN